MARAEQLDPFRAVNVNIGRGNNMSGPISFLDPLGVGPGPGPAPARPRVCRTNWQPATQTSFIVPFFRGGRCPKTALIINKLKYNNCANSTGFILSRGRLAGN